MRRLAISVTWLLMPSVGYGARGQKVEKAPSKDKVEWTGSKLSSESAIKFEYVGAARADFGEGRQARFAQSYWQLRHVVTRRTLRAFLLRLGLEYQRWNNHGPEDLPVPGSLNVVDAQVGMDFRWSRKDMLHVMVRPGLYSDFHDTTGGDLNMPIEIAYTRVPSNRFQWALGLSINPWRDFPYLPGGGFRYQINDRWKLRFLLPEPRVEYKARDDLHTWIGAEFRGDSFRVSQTFGNTRGDPTLNNAIVDYQDIRVGAGCSWNIKPLVELNAQAGYMVSRLFDYHNNDFKNASGGAPYVSVHVQWLIQYAPETEEEKTRGAPAMRFEIPVLRRFFK